MFACFGTTPATTGSHPPHATSTDNGEDLFDAHALDLREGKLHVETTDEVIPDSRFRQVYESEFSGVESSLRRPRLCKRTDFGFPTGSGTKGGSDLTKAKCMVWK